MRVAVFMAIKVLLKADPATAVPFPCDQRPAVSATDCAARSRRHLPTDQQASLDPAAGGQTPTQAASGATPRPADGRGRAEIHVVSYALLELVDSVGNAVLPRFMWQDFYDFLTAYPGYISDISAFLGIYFYWPHPL